MSSVRADVYEDREGAYRWRLVAANGRIVAVGGESFVSKSGAREAMETARELFANAATTHGEGG